MKRADSWSTPDHDTAVRMWLDGKSAGEIAKHFNDGRTRNSVIGRLTRHGFKREQPMLSQILSRLTGHRHRSKVNIPKPPKPAKPSSPKLAVIAMETEHEPLNLTIMELEPRSCRWITCEVDGDARFCGLPKEHGSYCCAHWRQATVPPKPHHRRAA